MDQLRGQSFPKTLSNGEHRNPFSNNENGRFCLSSHIKELERRVTKPNEMPGNLDSCKNDDVGKLNSELRECGFGESEQNNWQLTERNEHISSMKTSDENTANNFRFDSTSNLLHQGNSLGIRLSSFHLSVSQYVSDAKEKELSDYSNKSSISGSKSNDKECNFMKPNNDDYNEDFTSTSPGKSEVLCSAMVVPLSAEVQRPLSEKPSQSEEGNSLNYQIASNYLPRTENKSFSCNKCEKRFSQSGDLANHLRIHTGEKPFACDKCEKRFRTSRNLAQHRLIHTREKRFPCDKCDKRFKSSSNLAQHRRIHTGAKPFPCDKCKKRFRQKGDLANHLRIHTGEKPFACYKCEERFRTSSTLAQHRRTHTREKRFPCDKCEKRFRQSSSLANHRRIHTGQKPFPCDKCVKRFSRRSCLIRHRRTHTREKPFTCTICHGAFLHRRSLNTHYKNVHNMN